MKMADLDGLMKRIQEALVNLIRLRIVTAVGVVTVALNNDGSVKDVEIEQNGKAISTCVDLVGGDMTTVFDPEFVTGSYKSLREFHAAREKEGHDIVEKNLKALKALFDLVKELAKTS